MRALGGYPRRKLRLRNAGARGPSPRLRAQSSIALRALANLWDLEESLPEGKPKESNIHNAARAYYLERSRAVFTLRLGDTLS
jgi:hypothetical protein